MTAWHTTSKYGLPSTSAALLMASLFLVSCDSQPKSMFEQKAEAQAAHNIEIDSDDKIIVNSAGVNTIIPIDVSRQQVIARQLACDEQDNACQKLELNFLRFTPAQPWLSNIMWQSVARVLSPEQPLISQSQVAKDSIAALFQQIELSHRSIPTQPKYHRIDTELTLNQTADNLNTNKILTAYLLVKSSQQRSNERQQLNYVMLDVSKKLQLNIEDVLLPEVTTDDLLLAFQTSKKQWLIEQGVKPQYLESWPLALSKDWYLDQQGLHMVYQSGVLLDTELNAVDLMIPTAQLHTLIKRNYIVVVSTNFP